MAEKKFDSLNITVVEARNIAGVDKGGTSDPYVTLKSNFNKQTFKTKAISKTLTPKWNQNFSFFTSRAEGEVILRIYDKDLIFKDELLGEVTLRLSDFADGKEHDKWFQLVHEPIKKKKGGPAGEVSVRVQFTGPQETPRKESSATKPPSTAPPQTTNTNANSTHPVTNSNTQEAKPEVKAEPPSSKPANVEDKYDMKKVIGRGAFSVVREGIRKATGKKYAIKCISKNLIDKKELALLEREIDIMKKLQHPNIIQLMEVIDTPDTLYLVLEFASGGELFDAIVNRGSYSESDAANICLQILEAIKYVHDHGIAHRDLKPENLLLANEPGEKDKIKIADFGLSKDFGQEQLQTSCGTPDYVAPEVLMGEQYDEAVDIWSIGVITYVLLCGFPPFYGETQKELFENIMGGKYDFPEPEWTDVSEEAKNFIRKMLIVNSKERYTAEQALADPWLVQNTQNNKELKRLQSFSLQKFKEYNQKYKESNQIPTKAD